MEQADTATRSDADGVRSGGASPPPSRLTAAVAAFAAVILCLLWGAVWWAVSQDRNDTIAEAVKDSRNLARAFDEHVSSIMSGLDHVVQLVRLQYLAEGASLDLPRLLKRMTIPSSVLQIGILDARGRLLHSSAAAGRIDLSDREYYRFHRDHEIDTLFISRPVIGRVSSKLVLQLSRRIDRPDGSFGGVVRLSLDPQYFAEFYRQLDLGRGGLVTVVGTDGIVRARHDGGNFTLGQDISSGPLFKNLAMAPDGAYIALSSLDQARRYVSYRTLRDYPLVIAVGRLEHEVLHFFFERRGYVVMAGLAGTLLVAGSGLWLIALSRRQSRHAIEALDSRARLRAFMDSVPDAGWMKDRLGRFVAVNRAYAARRHMRPRDIVGKTDLDIFERETAERHRRDDEEVMRTAKLLRYEALIEHEGEKRWMETIKVPVYDANGTVSGACGVARDVTERKEVEAAARELNRMLEQRASELANANRALEAYSYTVSHDLHGPLRHISGFTRVVRDRLADHPDEHVLRLLDKITTATVRMSSMIDALLAFSRTGSKELHTEDVPLDALVAEVADELRTGASDRQIDWRIAPLPVVYGDRTLLRIALSNLVGNAVKYTRDRCPAVIEISATADDTGEVVVHIADNGVGFDPGDADRMFGVFERLHDDREFEGTGIGLATVRRVVERHGGRVWAEGSIGAGAIFHVALPRRAG